MSLLIVALSFSSCNEWLKVNPEGQLPEDDMFEKESGFEAALNGVYIEMKSATTYGGNLSMTAIEYLVSSWTVKSESTAEYLGEFSYGNSDVKSLMEGIFQQQYYEIAELNEILANVDERKDVFKTEGMYEQIKGECLGLRAYIHFDILRMFGPVPGTETDELILPYVTTVSKDYNKYSNYADFKSAFETDIEEAEALLTIAEEAGNYADYTSIRMNAEATRALQARAALWYGETTKAFDLAEGIINSTSTRLGTAADFQLGDYNLINEQILGLHVYNLSLTFDKYYSGQILYKGSDDVTVNTDLFGNSGTDIRETNLWNLFTGNSSQSVVTYSILKYDVSEDEASKFSLDYRRIPLIRLSEMYLIAAETASSSDLANTYWNTFRASRNLSELDLPDGETRKNEIAAEYRREFFAEGQAFYAYKRLNIDEDHFLWLPADAALNYVIPLPDSEVVQ